MDLYEIYQSKVREYEYLAKKVYRIKGEISDAKLLIDQRNLELEALEPLVSKKEIEMNKARIEWNEKHGK